MHVQHDDSFLELPSCAGDRYIVSNLCIGKSDDNRFLSHTTTPIEQEG
jgi:hypothetical protein